MQCILCTCLCENTYENSIRGGSVSAADTQKKAPANLSNVPLYIALYIGFPHKGVVESITATIEFIFPISDMCTILEIIVLAAIIMVPLSISTTGAAINTPNIYFFSTIAGWKQIYYIFYIFGKLCAALTNIHHGIRFCKSVHHTSCDLTYTWQNS